MNNLLILSEKLGHHFSDPTLLKNALSHRSISACNNERLEFLGDAILSYVIAAELFQRHPLAREGELSRMRSLLVNGDRLAVIAQDMNLGDFLRLGIGERKTGGQYRKSILADALEAVIGAIYLDSNIEETRRCILPWYGKQFENLSDIMPIKDPKSKLQEWLQAHKYPLPIYEATVTGMAHAQTFYVICRVVGLPFQGQGASSNRRKAEQLAAQQYLENLHEK